MEPYWIQVGAAVLKFLGNSTSPHLVIPSKDGTQSDTNGRRLPPWAPSFDGDDLKWRSSTYFVAIDTQLREAGLPCVTVMARRSALS
jgi:hypothetical protein